MANEQQVYALTLLLWGFLRLVQIRPRQVEHDEDATTKGNKMKVSVDLKVCVAHGRCYENFPELFERGPGGKSAIKVPVITDDNEDLQDIARSAAMMCPGLAINVEEE